MLRQNILLQALGIHTGVDNREVVRSSDVVIIAVKPYVVVDVLQDIASVVHTNHLIISVAAGFLTSHIERVRLFFLCCIISSQYLR